MNVLRRFFRNFFGLKTPKEFYESGREYARIQLSKTLDQSSMADHLYDIADGAFNINTENEEYDRGIRDQLHEMGYQAPYQNGNF